MVIMEKKAFLGVQKKRLPSKRNKKKNLLYKVLDYLRSDSYLFAPLTSSSCSPSDCRSYKIGIKENDKEKKKKKKKKKLVKKVGDYLMSDCYMYAPLVVPPSSKPLGVPPKGPQRYTKYITVEVARRSILLKESTHLANEIVKDKASKDPLPEKFVPYRRPLVPKETVKHAVYQNWRSTSDKGMFGSQTRKHF